MRFDPGTSRECESGGAEGDPLKSFFKKDKYALFYAQYFFAAMTMRDEVVRLDLLVSQDRRSVPVFIVYCSDSGFKVREKIKADIGISSTDPFDGRDFFGVGVRNISDKPGETEWDEDYADRVAITLWQRPQSPQV